MKFKKTISAVLACMYVLLMCVGCSSDNGGTNSGTNGGTVTDSDKNNSQGGNSDVTDDMDELKDDIKDTADDVKDSLTGEDKENSDAGSISGKSMNPANNANNINRQ